MSQDITQSFIEDYVIYAQNWKQDRLHRKMKVQDTSKCKFHFFELFMLIICLIIVIAYNKNVPSDNDILNNFTIGFNIFIYICYLFSSRKDDQFFHWLGHMKSSDNFEQDYNVAVNSQQGYVVASANGSSSNGAVTTYRKVERKLYPQKIRDWTGKFVNVIKNSQISVVTFYFHRKLSNKQSQNQYNRLLNQFKLQYQLGYNSYYLQTYQIQGFKRFQVSYSRSSTGKCLYILLNIAWLLCLSWPFKLILNLAIKKYQVTIDKQLTFTK